KARSSSGLRSRNRAGLPSRSSTSARLTSSSCSLASLSLPLAFLERLSTRFSRLSRSASISSVSMVSISASGAILPSTWVMSESSKQRTTCAMASTSRSEEHTSELQSPYDLVCRLLLEKKKNKQNKH